MIDKLESLQEEFLVLEQSLGDPELINDQSRYRTATQRYAELGKIVEVYKSYRNVLEGIDSSQEALQDAELAEMAREELERLEPKKVALEADLEKLLLPKDPYDDKNVIVEIRSAAGGDEAALFAAEVLNMYQRYAEKLGFQTELLDSHQNDIGGLSKVNFEITGRGAYSKFKFESGVHRVQRIPQTETQGRIHTSTITVAVMPEAEDVDVQISPSDYRVDIFRASGPGGQGVNTTDSAVRLVYKAGTEEEIVVQCQDGRSQIKNKEKALAVLRSRVLERQLAKAQEEQRENRLVQIGTGERSEKIRTYNFPQSRITDHRIGFTTHALTEAMTGDLDEVSQALIDAEQAQRLDELQKASNNATNNAANKLEVSGGTA